MACFSSQQYIQKYGTTYLVQFHVAAGMETTILLDTCEYKFVAKNEGTFILKNDTYGDINVSHI